MRRLHQIHAKDGTGLWHEFQGWNNSSALMLKAGLSGDLFKFQYEIIRGELRSLDPLFPSKERIRTGKLRSSRTDGRVPRFVTSRFRAWYF